MMLKDNRVSQLSIRGCSSGAGLSATTCGSTIDGVATTPNAFAEARQSWSLSGPTSSWRQEPRAWRRCGRRPTGYRSYSRTSASGRRRLRRKFGAAGRQHHRVHSLEFGAGAKWLELLKEVAPGGTRVAVLRDLTVGIAYLAAIQAVAPALGVELTPIGIRDAGEVERAVTAFARGSTDGMIVTPSTLHLANRELIATVAARHRLPAVYGFRYHVTVGGLLSYGPNSINLFRRAAGYVDRILKGEKQADLPVQAPTKYELVINLKAAKALGLEVPPTLLARADEVIE